MAINQVFHETQEQVAAEEEWVIDGSSTETGAAEVFEIGGEPNVRIYRETGQNVDVLIDAFDGPFHTQKNQLVVSQRNDHKIRIQVIEGSDAGDLYVTGMEVND